MEWPPADSHKMVPHCKGCSSPLGDDPTFCDACLQRLEDQDEDPWSSRWNGVGDLAFEREIAKVDRECLAYAAAAGPAET